MRSTNGPAARGRFTAPQSIYLDAVRGLSALAVMIGHGAGFLPSRPWLGNTYPIQSYAVVVFFVLSGLLIPYTVTRKQYGYSEYVLDRLARIFTVLVPIFLVGIVIDRFVMYDHFVLHPNFDLRLRTAVANIFMLHSTPFDRYASWLPFIQPFGSFRQLWTIAIEWWLYMLFGVLYFGWRADLRERTAMIAIFPIALAVVLFFTTRESVALVWVISAGIGLSLTTVLDRVPKRIARRAALLFGAMLIYRFMYLKIVAPLNAYDLQLAIFTVGLISSTLFALGGDLGRIGTLLVRTRSLWKWLAGISYSLYLIHSTLQYAYVALFGMDAWWDLAFTSAVGVGLAWICTLLFDRHHQAVANTLKSRLRVRSITDRQTIEVNIRDRR